MRGSEREQMPVTNGDWATARGHHGQWWARRGLVFWVTAPRGGGDGPPQPIDPEQHWYDPAYRCREAEHVLARTWYGGDAFPIARGWSAAGDLGVFLGARVELTDHTVWMHPVLEDEAGDERPPIHLDRENPWLARHVGMIEALVEASRGRYVVGMPDLVENIDVLASLRGTEALLLDMMDRPAWVERQVWEINDAYFEAFELFYKLVRDPAGGNSFVFNLWSPGRTAKVQCDACSTFGPAAFRRFVKPAMTRQCQWLDRAMFHLDGESCLPSLDEILDIEPLDAVEWTPSKLSVGDSGGNPRWHELYRRILAAGKSVQAIGVRPEEVIPLLDACGPQGMFITCAAANEADARALVERVETYR